MSERTGLIGLSVLSLISIYASPVPSNNGASVLDHVPTAAIGSGPGDPTRQARPPTAAV